VSVRLLVATVSPNGIMFVKPTLRKSLLAKMVGELLDTRVMIKQAMKGWKSDKVGSVAKHHICRLRLTRWYPPSAEPQPHAQLAPART
jgi:hypothetical protein